MKDVKKVKAGDRLKIPAIGGITVAELKHLKDGLK